MHRCILLIDALLLFGFFHSCRGFSTFCHRSESDLFLFLIKRKIILNEMVSKFK